MKSVYGSPDRYDRNPCGSALTVSLSDSRLVMAVRNVKFLFCSESNDPLFEHIFFKVLN